jgi:O-antigen/teichoic acid export membrane protein
MKRLIRLTHTLYTTARFDTLYLNAIFGILSSIVVAAGGFFFWIVSARLYAATDIGLATAVIATMTLLIHVSNLGLDSSLIRFLPTYKHKSEIISSAFLLIGITACFITTTMLFLIPYVSPSMQFLTQSLLTILLTLASLATAALSFTMESVFLSQKAAQYTALKNTLASVLKIGLLLIFLPLGAFGIFLSWTVGVAIALGVSLIILRRKFHFHFVQKLATKQIRHMAAFSGVNYAIGFLGLLPTFLIPLFITNLVSAQENAYYYIAMMIANLLYFLPFAITQSLFAEGAHDEENLLLHVKKSLKLISLTLFPAIGVILLAGNYLLLFFGEAYATGGNSLLQILAVAGIPVAGNYVFLTLSNIKRKLKTLLIVNSIGAVSITLLSFLFLPYGLQGIGVAWLLGQLIMNLGYGISLAPVFLTQKRIAAATV